MESNKTWWKNTGNLKVGTGRIQPFVNINQVTVTEGSPLVEVLCVLKVQNFEEKLLQQFTHCWRRFTLATN